MPIITLYAAVMTFVFLALARRVNVLRRAARVPLGDGGDRELARAMRAHAKCAEYAPLGIILIGLAESLSVPALIVHALGLSLVAGHIAPIVHADGVSQEPENFRFRVSGMGPTFTALAVAAGAALFGRSSVGHRQGAMLRPVETTCAQAAAARPGCRSPACYRERAAAHL